MTTAIATPALAAELHANIERRKGEIQSSIASYQRYIEGKQAELALVEQRFIEVFGLKAQLEAAGFKPEYDHWSECLRVDIEQKQLTAVYGVLGRLDGSKAEKDIVDSAKRLVKVTLAPVNHPSVRVSYVTKLPRRGGKCRIVTVRQKARSEKQLVCEV